MDKMRIEVHGKKTEESLLYLIKNQTNDFKLLYTVILLYHPLSLHNNCKIYIQNTVRIREIKG